MTRLKELLDQGAFIASGAVGVELVPNHTVVYTPESMSLKVFVPQPGGGYEAYWVRPKLQICVTDLDIEYIGNSRDPGFGL